MSTRSTAVVTAMIAAIALTALGAASAGAADNTEPTTLALDTGVVVPALSVDRTDLQDAQFREALLRLAGSGASDAEIESELGLVRVSAATVDDAVPGRPSAGIATSSMVASLDDEPGAEVAATPKDLDKLLNTLRGDKIQLCSGNGPYDMHGTTSPNSLTLGTPAFYWSSGAEYYVLAGWNWTSEAEYLDLNCGHKIGGYDGFGIRIDKSVTNLGTSLAVCLNGDCGYKLHTQFVTESNQNGAAWRFQDIAYYTGMANKTGIQTFRFKFQKSGCTQASSKYGHSWSDTALTGIDVGAYSLGLSWSSTTSHFAKAPSTTGKRTC